MRLDRPRIQGLRGISSLRPNATTSRILSLLLCALVAPACQTDRAGIRAAQSGHQPRDVDSAPGVPVEGGECSRSASITACGASPRGPTILECVSGRWTEAKVCEEHCGATNQCTAGCAQTNDGLPPSCLCADGASCPGRAYCESHEVIRHADASRENCHTLCTAAGAETSLGCGFDPKLGEPRCICATSGQSCTDELDICAGPSEAPPKGADSASTWIATCESGSLAIAACSDVCSDENSLCLQVRGQPDACSCQT